MAILSQVKRSATAVAPFPNFALNSPSAHRVCIACVSASASATGTSQQFSAMNEFGGERLGQGGD